MIHINNLQKQFGDIHVFKGITCDIQEKEVISIIGPSGSGKSTFLRCINGLEDITSGEIEVNGFKVHDPKININRLRESVEWCFNVLICFHI